MLNARSTFCVGAFVAAFGFLAGASALAIEHSHLRLAIA